MFQPAPDSPPTLHAQPDGLLAKPLAQVRDHLEGLVADYPAEQRHLSEAVGRLLLHSRADPLSCALPLAVHAALTGAPEPAVPVAAAHDLWWRAANAFDDLADDMSEEAADEAHGTPAMSGTALMTAALECFHTLPMRILMDVPAAPAVREGLLRDLAHGCTRAVDGQLHDLAATPAGATPHTVLAAYRHKSGAPYAMACALAARLATGSAEATYGTYGEGTDNAVAEWGRFGELLGLLAQLRNDYDDLRTGRFEDFANGTATYLLVQHLHRVPAPRAERTRALLHRCAEDPGSRSDLRDLLLEPEALHAYREYVHELRHAAEDLLGRLATPGPFAAYLREQVTATAHACLPAEVP
ncbi:hypothetical protein [Streptomyces sp. ODS28]|uniref:hypothetical protein n=1 Tax=Streptomyces sp. ODS28 TaxID=3136688 RepID=UPI0031F059A7